ncbi:MAG TPA: SBBP repeat-containing protein [Candidatus Binataceae bacterium]|nr:SBBP repeat-containing protein [Candidatus Binataceae bacterium]
MQSVSAHKYAPTRIVGGVFLVVGVGLLLGASIASQPARNPIQPQRAVRPAIASAAPVSQHAAILSSYGKLPLGFEANNGQTDRSVRYLAHNGPVSVFLTRDGAIISISRQDTTPGRTKGSVDPRPGLRMLARDSRAVRTAAFKVSFEGSARRPTLAATDRLPGTTNYLIGNDRSKWHTGINSFGRVKYESVYPGIDLAFYGTNGRLEYDIDIAPGADPSAVKMKFDGADSLRLDRDGNLIASVGGERGVIGKPVAYQADGAERRPVKASYVLSDKSKVTVALGDYDHTKPLVIDPSILYSTFLGGTIAEVQAIAVDPTGNAYITGWTCCGSNFPLLGGVQKQLNGIDNAFVTKLNVTGALVYSTYLGGSQTDVATGIAFDTAGDTYISGYTDSANFPVTSGGGSLSGGFDAFLTSLNPAGNSIRYSMYLGGSGDDLGMGVAAEPGGTAYITGQTFSDDFPTTISNAYQTENPSNGVVSSGFLTRIDPPTTTGGSPTMSYSTYFGGPAPSANTPTGVTFLNGAAYGGVTGTVWVAGGGGGSAPVTIPQFGGILDAIVATFDTTKASSQSLIFSRFLGGSSIDVATGIATGSNCTVPCAATVGGYTFSADLPNSRSAFGGLEDGFIAKIDSRSGINSINYIGTTGFDDAFAVGMDSSGQQYIGGTTFRVSEASQTEPLQPTPAINGGLFTSTTNSQTFSIISDAGWKSTFGSVSPQALAIDNTIPTNQIPSGTIIYAGTNTMGLYRSTDLGKTFFSVTTFLSAQVSAIAIAKTFGHTGPQPVYVTANNQLYTSGDGGQSFGAISSLPAGSGLPANSYWVASDLTGGLISNPGSPSSNVLVWQGNKNGFYISTNQGATFAASTGIAGAGQRTQVFSGIEDVKHAILYIGTDKGIFVSTDSGFTFAPTNVNSDVILSMAIDTTTTPYTVYAGTFGDGVIASNDGFINNLRQTAVVPNSVFNYVAVDDASSNPAIVYAGVGDNQRMGTLWKSSNAAATFSRIDSASQPCCMFPLAVTNGKLFAGNYRESDGYFYILQSSGSFKFASSLGGGNYDEITGIGASSNGDTFLAGLTFSSDFPLLNPAQKKFGNTSTAPIVNGFATRLGFTSTGKVTAPTQTGFAGKIKLRTVSKPLTVTVQNTGTGPLVLGYLRVQGGDNFDFVIIPNVTTVKGLLPCAAGGTLAAKGKCGVELEFKPLSPGQRVSTLLLPSNASNGTQGDLLVGQGTS